MFGALRLFYVLSWSLHLKSFKLIPYLTDVSISSCFPSNFKLTVEILCDCALIVLIHVSFLRHFLP